MLVEALVRNKGALSQKLRKACYNACNEHANTLIICSHVYHVTILYRHTGMLTCATHNTRLMEMLLENFDILLVLKDKAENLLNNLDLSPGKYRCLYQISGESIQ